MPTVIENDPLRPWLPLRAAARRWFATTSAASASQPGSRSANSSPPVRYRAIAATQVGGHDLGDRTEDLVPGAVAVRVVDRLEVVDVDDQQRERGALVARDRELQVELLLERSVVAETGEPVTERVEACTIVRPRADRFGRGRRPPAGGGRAGLHEQDHGKPHDDRPADTGEMGDSTTSGTSTGRTLRTIAPAATRKARRKPASTSLTTDRAAARSSCGCVGGRDLKARGTSCRCLGRDPI